MPGLKLKGGPEASTMPSLNNDRAANANLKVIKLDKIINETTNKSAPITRIGGISLLMMN